MKEVNRAYVGLAISIAVASLFATNALTLYLTVDQNPLDLLLLLPSFAFLLLAYYLAKRCGIAPNKVTSNFLLKTSVVLCSFIAIATMAMAMYRSNLGDDDFTREFNDQVNSEFIITLLQGGKHVIRENDFYEKQHEAEMEALKKATMNEWKFGVRPLAKIGLALSIAWATLTYTSKDINFKPKSIRIVILNLLLTFLSLLRFIPIILVITIGYTFLLRLAMPELPEPKEERANP